MRIFIADSKNITIPSAEEKIHKNEFPSINVVCVLLIFPEDMQVVPLLIVTQLRYKTPQKFPKLTKNRRVLEEVITTGPKLIPKIT